MKNVLKRLATTSRAIRYVLRAAVIGIILFIVVSIILGTAVHFHGPWLTTDPPDITEAPWIVQTSTRFYYAKQYTLDGATPKIKDYWTFDGESYEYIERELAFPKSLYGQVKVIRRTDMK